jgi:hypothetical protein
MSSLVLPPNYLKIDGPMIFLAGPIQGAYDWQKDAISLIHSDAPDVYVASPRRQSALRGDFKKGMFDEQVDWEIYHMRLAGENGVVLFWLTKEFEHICDRAYAQTSRFELAEWKARHEGNGAKMVVGIEEGFTGMRYILRRFSQDCPDVPLLRTLEETCREAVKLIR